MVGIKNENGPFGGLVHVYQLIEYIDLLDPHASGSFVSASYMAIISAF